MADGKVTGIILIFLIGLIVLVPSIQPLLLIGAFAVIDMYILAGLLQKLPGIPSLIIFSAILAVGLYWVLVLAPLPVNLLVYLI